MFDVFKKINIVFIFLISIMLVSGCSANKEGVVAKVEGEEILEEDINAEYEIFETIYIKQFGEDAMSQKGEDGRTLADTLREQILEKSIIEKIIELETEKQDIQVSEEEIDEKIQEYILSLGGEEEFDEFLEANKLTREYFRDDLKKETLAAKHRERFIETVEIKDQEAEEFFNSNKEKLEVIRASHILLKTEEEAQALLSRIENGEDFEDLAREFSVDKASASNGGDLGYFTRGTRIDEFEELAFNLEEGEVSQVLKTEVGYHIIKLLDKKDEFKELESEVKMVLKEEKYKEEIIRLRESYKVKVYLED